MINRRIQVVTSNLLNHGIRFGMVGKIVRLLDEHHPHDVRVEFSRGVQKNFSLHEVRYINGRRVVIRMKPEPSPVGKQVKLKKTCLFYHPDVCIVKVVAVDKKLNLLTVLDDTGCKFAVYLSEVTYVNGRQVSL